MEEVRREFETIYGSDETIEHQYSSVTQTDQAGESLKLCVHMMPLKVYYQGIFSMRGIWDIWMRTMRMSYGRITHNGDASSSVSQSDSSTTFIRNLSTRSLDISAKPLIHAELHTAIFPKVKTADIRRAMQL
jgi:hypothetical protein